MKNIDTPCFMIFMWNEEKENEEDRRSVDKEKQVDEAWKESDLVKFVSTLEFLFKLGL